MLYISKIFLFVICLFLCPISVSATTYYLSPAGNDNNNGTATSPWKTISKANSSVSSGDTIILKNGIYQGSDNAYEIITKSNTTWKAENKHQAVIDGGFPPSLLKGSWENIVTAWDENCDSKKGQYVPLLGILNASNVTLDGIFLRNSCGRGFSVTTSDGGQSDNVLITNSRADWTFVAGIFARPDTSDPDFPNQLKNFQFINNILTRNSFNDEYKVRTGDKKYGVNITTLFGGINPIVRGNLIAWGKGEVAPDASNGLLFEDNVIVGNKNNLYFILASNAVVRNNLFYAPETNKTENSHMGYLGRNNSDWHMGLRNEEAMSKMYKTPNNNNISYYNNLIINTGLNIDCYNRPEFPTYTSQIYFGNNTFVASKNQQKMLTINCTQITGSETDPVLTGLFENNIMFTAKNPNVIINPSLSNNDAFTFRYNIWPTNTSAKVKGQGDIYTNDPGLVNGMASINLDIPGIGVSSIDTKALLAVVDVNNYRLKQTSSAINKSTTLGSLNNTAIPPLARTKDYFKATRIGVADLGAVEFTGSNPPTQIPFTPPPNTPTSIDSNTDFDLDQDIDWLDILLFLPRFSQSNQPIFDLNNNGIVDLFDFATSLNTFTQP